MVGCEPFDPVAFWAKAYNDNFDPLCRQARCNLTGGNSAEAEDAVSEAFFRVMRYAKNPEAIVNLPGYIWQTARRVVFTKRRKENTSQMDSLDEILTNKDMKKRHPTVQPDALRILENREFMDKMRVEQGPLTPREELLLALHLKGLNCKEIAARLNEDRRLISTELNAVRNKVHYRLTKKAKTKVQ